MGASSSFKKQNYLSTEEVDKYDINKQKQISD